MGSIYEQSPQLNESFALSKDYSMSNISDCKQIKDSILHGDLTLVDGINEENLVNEKEQALATT